MTIKLSRYFVYIATILLLISCGKELELYNWNSLERQLINIKTNQTLAPKEFISYADLGINNTMIVQEGHSNASSSLLFPATSGIQTRSQLERLNVYFDYLYLGDTLIDSTFFYIDTLSAPNATMIFDTTDVIRKTTIQTNKIDSLINDMFVVKSQEQSDDLVINQDTFNLNDFISYYGAEKGGAMDSTFSLLMKERPMYNSDLKNDSVKFNFSLEVKIYSSDQNWDNLLDFDTTYLVEPGWNYTIEADTIKDVLITYDTIPFK